MKNENDERKVIQIAVANTQVKDNDDYSNDYDEVIIALCNDGTIWRKTFISSGNLSKQSDWIRLQNIPQGNTEKELELEYLESECEYLIAKEREKGLSEEEKEELKECLEEKEIIKRKLLLNTY